MNHADVPDVVVMPETFAKAGNSLKLLNDGGSPDLTPCGEVARVLDHIRTKEGFQRLEDKVQDKLRTAAGSVNSRLARNESMLLNFFSEAFGATKRPHKADPIRRDRIGTFLVNVASM